MKPATLNLGDDWESYGDHALEEAKEWNNAFEAFEIIKELLLAWQDCVQAICGHDPDGQIQEMIADGATRPPELMYLVFFKDLQRAVELYK